MSLCCQATRLCVNLFRDNMSTPHLLSISAPPSSPFTFLFLICLSHICSSVIRRLSLKDASIGQISVPWTLFGSSGHIKMPRCVVNSFLWAQHRTDPIPVKSIVCAPFVCCVTQCTTVKMFVSFF